MMMSNSGDSFQHRFRDEDVGNRYFFFVEADGFAPVRSPESPVAKQMPPLTIDLQPDVYVPIRGHIMDRQGKPVADARVQGRPVHL